MATETEELTRQLATERERADYAWRNTRTIEAARQEEMRKRDALEAENGRLRALAQDLLDPERFGFAVTAEVRDAARRALGKMAVETEFNAEVRGASRLAGEASSGEAATSTAGLGAAHNEERNG